MSIDPHDIDDAELKQQLEEAVGNLSSEDLERVARSDPPATARHERGQRHGHGHGHGHAPAQSRISGTIIDVRGVDVFVDIGGKSEGVIALDEFDPDEPPIKGATMQFVPHGFDHESGLMRLSLEETLVETDLDSVKVGDVVKAKVTGTNIGGLELRVHGIRCFMPKSQVDVERHEDFAPFINHWLESEVTEVNRRGKSLILSRRRVLEREQAVQREHTLTELKEGEERTGVVRRLASFGAFVDLGGIDGLLHISDMSYGRIRSPKEVVKVNEEVRVRVLKIDREQGRISLGLKQMQQDPWELVPSKYAVGATLDGRVVRLMNFGAFVELEPGVEGLVPVSEMSWTQRVHHPKEILKEGDSVRVALIAIDPEKQKLTLSLKALSEDPWNTVEQRYQEGATVSGAVARIAEFGAFIQLEEGVDGLVHISELSDKPVHRVTQVCKPGDVVQVRVKSVDKENRRISLSMKSGTSLSAEADTSAAPTATRKKSKPRRGGLEF